MVSALVAAFGAVAAAIAGFATKHEGWRKPSATVAVLAAALPMVPRMLPDESRLETELARSGRHQLAGIKAEAQLEDFLYEDTRREYRKYVKARFAECASRDASEAVPDFPKVEVAAAAEEMAATTPMPSEAHLGNEPRLHEHAAPAMHSQEQARTKPAPSPLEPRERRYEWAARKLVTDAEQARSMPLTEAAPAAPLKDDSAHRTAINGNPVLERVPRMEGAVTAKPPLHPKRPKRSVTALEVDISDPLP